MKKQRGIKLAAAFALALGLLSSTAALANDVVWGALLGGGAGALVGRSIGGRDGTIIGGALGAAAGAAIGADGRRTRVVEYAPPPVYYPPPAYREQQVYYAPPADPQEVYYAPPVRYYAPPVRVEQRQIYYVREGYDRDYRRHRHHRDDDWPRQGRDWGDRY